MSWIRNPVWGFLVIHRSTSAKRQTVSPWNSLFSITLVIVMHFLGVGPRLNHHPCIDRCWPCDPWRIPLKTPCSFLQLVNIVNIVSLITSIHDAWIINKCYCLFVLGLANLSPVAHRFISQFGITNRFPSRTGMVSAIFSLILPCHFCPWRDHKRWFSAILLWTSWIKRETSPGSLNVTWFNVVLLAEKVFSSLV